MVTYKKPQQRKEKDSERLRERDQIKFIDLRIEKDDDVTSLTAL